MYYIGIDIGGMSIKAGLTDETGKIYTKATCETFPERNYTEIVKDIASLCYKVCDEAKIDINDVKAVGMGIPGTINSKKGEITYANNINFDRVPIVKEFNKHINVPTFIGNDANCAALGEEKFGSAKGYKDIVFITLGTGVGSGIIIDGKLLEGRNGAGAEGGHIIIRFDGEQCTCGAKGCYEAYASATALIKQTEKAMAKNPDSMLHKVAKEQGKVSGRVPFIAAEQGDKVAIKVINNYVKYVSEGLLSLINLFRPEVVLLGGGISNAGPFFIDKVQRRVSRYSYGKGHNPKVKVTAAALKNDAGILGAVALCLQ